MDFILRVWAAAIADPIAYFFCAVILGAFILGVAILPVPSWRRSRLSAYLPTFMTTLGLLGTFLGVLIGLLDFNVEDIDASVPSLLAGLKIAFITSIFGIMGSVMLRLMQALFPSGGIRTGVTPGDIYAVLTSLRQDGAAHAERMETSLDRVKDAIAAEGDGSLISQIQKL